MARPAIFLTLIAAILIGPLLCCCTFGPVAWVRSTTAETPVSRSQLTCRHCRIADPAPASPNSKPECPSKPCPWREGRATATAVAPPFPDFSI